MADFIVESNGTCEKVGEALPDIAGIGVLVSFAGQSLLSLLLATWVFFLSETGRLDIRHDEGTEEHTRETKRLETFSQLLLVGNDVQMLLGIAYMITAWTKQSQIGLYHLRLVFDTVSFVGISSTVALVSNVYCHGLLGKAVSRRSARYLTTYIFAIFFVALTVIVIARHSEWNEHSEIPGLCYTTDGSLAVIDQPISDILYVSVTGTWLLGVMMLAALAGPRRRWMLLLSAFVQYPVHLYFMVFIRHVNQPLLEGSEREDNWDFGQTTAILLLGFACIEAAHKTLRYRRWRWDLKFQVEAREYQEKWDVRVDELPV